MWWEGRREGSREGRRKVWRRGRGKGRREERMEGWREGRRKDKREGRREDGQGEMDWPYIHLEVLIFRISSHTAQ